MAAAQQALAGRVRLTPLLESDVLARDCGAARLFVKAEGLQRTGSFKLRGALWRLMQLTDAERARGVVAFSSGNFAQGLAAAGRDLEVPVTIVMPWDAPAAKRLATEALGAEVVLSHHGDAPREVVAAGMARDLAAERGLVLLHPFDDVAVIAGQGTAAVEALAQMREAGAEPDVVVCPVGGGGLMGGVSLMMRGAHPGVAIWGCEPVGHDGLGRSLRAGERVAAPGGATLCDALQAPMPGVANFAACQAAGVAGLAVADGPVAQAMARAFEVLKLVLEPSGAVALAAVLAGQVPVAGKVVLVVASGGNVAFDRFADCLALAARKN
ncbi:MAG: serine/threonine dehydratase [Rhodobacter sp.]|nr:serine/threonine dehydratase [Rhodobacter sp.]